ncbi:hypothetical protein [Peribacillus frigoritolerans]|uniref:hypothetical protein n=1 Tax=Peribacillus castrilensis TaxID=2897690 RepID=UPI002DC22A6F|nr:hypothetical protein [Peribacillus castrilensis]
MKRNPSWLSVTLTLTLIFNFLVTSKSIEAKQNQESDVKETGETYEFVPNQVFPFFY